MGVFKEEANEFEGLIEKEPRDGYRTDREADAANLEKLRGWMREMSSMKSKRETVGNTRADWFFIAWEEDEGFYRGTEYVVLTRKLFGDVKVVTLQVHAKSYRPKDLPENWAS